MQLNGTMQFPGNCEHLLNTYLIFGSYTWDGTKQTTAATKGCSRTTYHSPTSVTIIFYAILEPQLFRGINPYASLTLLMATLGSVRVLPYQFPWLMCPRQTFSSCWGQQRWRMGSWGLDGVREFGSTFLGLKQMWGLERRQRNKPKTEKFHVGEEPICF